MRLVINNGKIEFAGNAIIEHINFDIKDNSKIAIIGSNGSGKTSLLKVIEGELDLTFDSSIYTKETYDEEKLNRLEKAKDKVKYTLEITLTKNDKDEWQLDALTNEQMKKIQGMY